MVALWLAFPEALPKERLQHSFGRRRPLGAGYQILQSKIAGGFVFPGVLGQ